MKAAKKKAAKKLRIVLLLVLCFAIVTGLTIVGASKVWTVWTVQIIQETWLRCPKVEKYKTADEGDT